MHTGSGTGSILVTGAARGIGRAVADLFLAGGWRVGMYDVDGDAVAQAAGGRTGAVHGVLDVRDPDQWRATLMRFCVDGRLDVLVDNVGVLASGPFSDMDVDTHRRMVDVNVTGVVHGAALGFPICAAPSAGCCSTSARRRPSTASRRWPPTARRRPR